MVFILCMEKLNKLDEFNLLNDILNTPKRTNILDIRYSPILQGCMNTRKVKSRFKKF